MILQRDRYIREKFSPLQCDCWRPPTGEGFLQVCPSQQWGPPCEKELINTLWRRQNYINPVKRNLNQHLLEEKLIKTMSKRSNIPNCQRKLFNLLTFQAIHRKPINSLKEIVLILRFATLNFLIYCQSQRWAPLEFDYFQIFRSPVFTCMKVKQLYYLLPNFSFQLKQQLQNMSPSLLYHSGS